jgi:hypothetical protein
MSNSSSASAHIASTLESLSKGLAAAKPGAKASIHSWVTATKEAGLDDAAKELTALEGYLGDMDVEKIAGSLSKLGKMTIDSAKDKDSKLHELGQALTDAAKSLKAEA